MPTPKTTAAPSSRLPQVKAVSEDPPREPLGLVAILTYVLFAAFLTSYAAFLYDRPGFAARTAGISGLENLATVFDVIEKYSPFHEFIDDDLIKRTAAADQQKDNGSGKPKKRKVFTAEELKIYDGSTKGKGPYLALLGQVFDVSKGAQHYGPGGGYAFFSGKDASRAFVTGEFNDKGLTDDVMGLDSENYLGLDEWVKFYRKDYKRVGVLEGRFFDAAGEATAYTRQVRNLIEDAHNEKAASLEEHDVFPPCNSAWSEGGGHRVWCTPKSGGIDRTWAGVPRRLFTPGGAAAAGQERCACVKDTGHPVAATAGSEDGNRGDLDHPHLKDYPGCDPKSESCQLSVSSSSSDTAKTEVDDSDLEDMSAEELRRMGIVDSFPVE